MKLFTALFFAATVTVVAQNPSPQVPRKLKFADLTLTIHDDARQEIQKDVDAFTRYPKSFNIKVERAKTYFPIIEKIFAEENVPDDMKYLVIQESALIPDAVSTSNAVGFWQFKDFTAVEMGLRVDKEIDERLNIVSASRAAARYLKKNNGFFDNWLFALQAYQMGAGGVMRSEKDTKGGAKHMDITHKTYWYVKKYLAHKIAYENAVKGEGEIKVLTYQNKNAKTLAELAREVSIEEEELKAYNKWTKSGKIPDDRTYTVLIPVKDAAPHLRLPDDVIAEVPREVVEVEESPVVLRKEDKIKINGITAVRAVEHESPSKFAARMGVELSSFLKWNDLAIHDRLVNGQYYLLGKKRNRATTSYHKVSDRDNLWLISQQYGVKIKRLKRYNRLRQGNQLEPGTTLWLSSMKPKDADKLPDESKGDIVEVSASETFGWTLDASTPVNADAGSEAQAPRQESISSKPEPIANESMPATKEAESASPLRESATVTTAPVTPADPPADVLTEASEPPQPVDSPDSSKTLQLPEPEKIRVDSMPDQSEPAVVESKKTEHTVLAGETLYGIARQYKVGVMDLASWNGLDIQERIKPGQVIKVSDPQMLEEETQASAGTTQQVHEVRPTDTVYSISRKYGVTIKELMEWNNKKDFNLSVGEKLKIPKK